MRKKVAILGSTGSIGTQALDVISKLGHQFEVVLLSGYSNTQLLTAQCQQFGVKSIYAKSDFLPLEDLAQAQTYENCDIVINGIAGLAGLMPSIAALQSGATLATANKESIICGWQFLQSAEAQGNGKIIPVDSEHSTIFRLLQGQNLAQVDKLILTASGGAFRDLTRDEIANKKARDALLHPVWKMGKKVTIDSATLMNKGLEIIEAKRLFGLGNIEVLGHRESIIHSMIQLTDNTIIAGLSSPDMRIPIAYALTYPIAEYSKVEQLDLIKTSKLHFFAIEQERFPCLEIAKRVSLGTEAQAVILNASNEIMVRAYLTDAIGFYDISYYIEQALDYFDNCAISKLDDIFSIDKEVKEYTIKKLNLGGLIDWHSSI